MAMLITGASQGLGHNLIRTYLARGETVIGCSRRGAKFDSPNYIDHRIDVTNDTEVKDLFRGLGRRKIKVQKLIHSAGISQSTLALMTSAEAARNIMNVNFTGTFLITREAIKHMMRTQFGRIVTISSVNVPLHSRGGSIYNASKAAAENLMKTLTSELSQMDITFNSLGLSIVKESGMSNDLSEAASEEKRAQLDKPDDLDITEIVHALDFLVHPAAAKVSGQTIYLGAP